MHPVNSGQPWHPPRRSPSSIGLLWAPKLLQTGSKDGSDMRLNWMHKSVCWFYCVRAYFLYQMIAKTNNWLNCQIPNRENLYNCNKLPYIYVY